MLSNRLGFQSLQWHTWVFIPIKMNQASTPHTALQKSEYYPSVSKLRCDYRGRDPPGEHCTHWHQVNDWKTYRWSRNKINNEFAEMTCPESSEGFSQESWHTPAEGSRRTQRHLPKAHTFFHLSTALRSILPPCHHPCLVPLFSTNEPISFIEQQRKAPPCEEPFHGFCASEAGVCNHWKCMVNCALHSTQQLRSIPAHNSP